MSLTRFQMCIDGQWVDALSGNAALNGVPVHVVAC